MKDGWRNFIKTFMGWLIGIPIIAFMSGVSATVQATLLCLFYTGFYTIIDKILRWIEYTYNKKAEKKSFFF